MSDWLQRIFSGDGFMPHGHCYLWTPGLIWLHVVADSLIALAYYSIPLTLVYFVRKRRDIPYPWMFLMFGGFIVACGTTHLMEIWSIWHSTYWLSGGIKAVTAMLSIATAILLVKLVPEAMALRSPTELAALNGELEREVNERNRAEESLRQAHAGLEARVRERTEELARANDTLQREISERKRAEEQVRRLNADLERHVKELQTIFDVIPIGIAIARDAACHDLRVNRAYVSLLGAPPDANALKDVPPGEAPEKFRVFHQGGELPAEKLPMQVAAATGGEVREFDQEIVFQDGRRLHLLGYAAPLLDEDNTVRGSVGAFVDISDRQRAEERFRLAVEASPSGIVMVNREGKIALINTQAEKMFGYRREELVGQSMEILVPARFRAPHPGFRRSFHEKPQPRAMGAGRDLFALRRDGTEFPVEIGLNPLETTEGTMVLSTIVDITGRRQAEEKIQASLREKEVLLKEIHHRVKNNLQIVSSLLNLQAGHLRHPDTLAAFKESRIRVQSMALVHEKLYQSENLSELDFSEYSQSLLDNLFRSFGADPQRIRRRIEVDSVKLDINLVIPCALILNELVSNSLKYAFPGERAGEILIALRRQPDGRLRLLVSDNGVGFSPPPEAQKVTTLGLQLINTLVNQLHGRLEIRSSGGGTEFAIAFSNESLKGNAPSKSNL